MLTPLSTIARRRVSATLLRDDGVGGDEDFAGGDVVERGDVLGASDDLVTDLSEHFPGSCIYGWGTACGCLGERNA